MTTRAPETHLPAHDPRASADRFAHRAAEYLFSPFRWFGTVVLENGLGLFFLLAPHLTLQILGAEDSSYSATLFQLYGAILIHRGMTQQIFYRRRDLHLFRQFLWASFPFSIGSTVVLCYAVLHGLMSPWIGWFIVVTFAWEIVDNGAILWATRGLGRDFAIDTPAPSRA